MTDDLKIAMIDVERDVITMSIDIDKLGTDEDITVTIMGEEFDVSPLHHNVTVGSLIKDAYDRKSETHLIKYLKTKYDGYQGLPVHLLNDELLLDSKTQVENFLKIHYENKWNRIEFVPFEIVADYIMYAKDAQ